MAHGTRYVQKWFVIKVGVSVFETRFRAIRSKKSQNWRILLAKVGIDTAENEPFEVCYSRVRNCRITCQSDMITFSARTKTSGYIFKTIFFLRSPEMCLAKKLVLNNNFFLKKRARGWRLRGCLSLSLPRALARNVVSREEVEKEIKRWNWKIKIVFDA